MGMIPIHEPYTRSLGSEVTHRTNHYLNNRLEQDHRGIKQRYYSHAWVWKRRLCLTLLQCLR